MKRFVSLLLGVSVIVGLVFVTAYAEGRYRRRLVLTSKFSRFFLSSPNPSTRPPAQNVRPGRLFSGVASDLAENDFKGQEVCLKSSRPNTWRFRN